MTVNLELAEVTEAQMYALANFLKRVSREDFKQYAESDEEAKLMACAVANLHLAIDRAGYEVW